MQQTELQIFSQKDVGINFGEDITINVRLKRAAKRNGAGVSGIRRLRKRARRGLNFPRPYLDFTPIRMPAIRRGTDYGGWWFIPESCLAEGLVVSAGAGEDISFDIALAGEFGAHVHIIDPTPRAIRHVESVLNRMGLSAEETFVRGGCQPPTAYDLSNIDHGQILLHQVALWNTDCELDFMPPINQSHVSHTVGAWREISPLHDALKVRGCRLSTIIERSRDQPFALLKLDIEGSEIEVVEDVLRSGLRPRQFLIEFDQLALPNKEFRLRARKAFRALKFAGYRVFRRERLNFSFYCCN